MGSGSQQNKTTSFLNITHYYYLRTSTDIYDYTTPCHPYIHVSLLFSISLLSFIMRVEMFEICFSPTYGTTVIIPPYITFFPHHRPHIQYQIPDSVNLPGPKINMMNYHDAVLDNDVSKQLVLNYD